MYKTVFFSIFTQLWQFKNVSVECKYNIQDDNLEAVIGYLQLVGN